MMKHERAPIRLELVAQYMVGAVKGRDSSPHLLEAASKNTLLNGLPELPDINDVMIN
jgi:hypothetical protein